MAAAIGPDPQLHGKDIKQTGLQETHSLLWLQAREALSLELVV